MAGEVTRLQEIDMVIDNMANTVAVDDPASSTVPPGGSKDVNPPVNPSGDDGAASTVAAGSEIPNTTVEDVARVIRETAVAGIADAAVNLEAPFSVDMGSSLASPRVATGGAAPGSTTVVGDTLTGGTTTDVV